MILSRIKPDNALVLRDEIRNANLPAARQVKYEVWELRHSHLYGEVTKLSETIYFAGILESPKSGTTSQPDISSGDH